MSRTYKANAQHPIRRSAWYANWQQREAQLKQQQMTCRHLRYVQHSNTFGTYAVCTSCDKHLGYIGNGFPGYVVKGGKA
jgi:hypothetical protein